MLNKSLYEEMPIIIFQKELDSEDVDKIVALFENWFVDEINKRISKMRGKLFEFTFSMTDSSASLMFGSHKNGRYVNVLEGDCGDFLRQEAIHKSYKQVVERALEIADRLVKENDLSKELVSTEGIASIYVISR